MSASLFTPEQVRFLASRRVGRLATATADGRPHVVPVCYAFDGALLYTPIDEKPKRVGAGELRRIRNLRENPQVSLVVDDYDEDWSKLAFVIVRGRAEIVERGDERSEALGLLREKYPQYRAMALEERPLLVIEPESVAAWGRVG